MSKKITLATLAAPASPKTASRGGLRSGPKRGEGGTKHRLPKSSNRAVVPTSVQFHINRVVGQIRGAGKMIQEKKDNISVIRQIMAAEASLEQLAIRLLKEESKVCDKKRIDKIVDILFRLS